LLCSEYGWTKDYILDHVTPAQAGLLIEAIARRRRTELARQVAAIRTSVWGDERQLEELTRELTGGDDKRDDVRALAAMGILVERRSQGGSGDDDGQPAG